MVYLLNYLSYSKLYFKNHFKYMGTSISIRILVLYTYTVKNAVLILSKKKLKQVKYLFFQAIFYLSVRYATITNQESS